jgi:choline dehydrogenase-like flavoprotein
VYAAPPHPWRCTEIALRDKLAKLHVPVISERTAVLSRPYDGRPGCHYCGSCGIGCDVRARFSSLDVIIPKLRDKKNFTLRTHAVAREVLVNKEGRAAGISFVDANDRKDYEVRAKAVVLAASTGETGRLLLNSKSRFHPNGIGNSSGLVGHYLMDSTKSGGMSGIVPEWRNRKRQNEDGAGGTHITIPRFNYNRKNNYHGGYFLLVGTGFGRSVNAGVGGYGASLKQEIYSQFGSLLTLRGYGERIPDHNNYFEIDPERKDQYGIPQLRFRCEHGENELKMMDDMYATMEEIMKAAGAEVLPYRKYLEPMGDATHECGTARMGTDPKTSVLSPFGQSHDVKNLFVTDGSAFVSLPGTHGITTWIMSLSWRASEYLVEGMRKGEIHA